MSRAMENDENTNLIRFIAVFVLQSAISIEKFSSGTKFVLVEIFIYLFIFC